VGNKKQSARNTTRTIAHKIAITNVWSKQAIRLRKSE